MIAQKAKPEFNQTNENAMTKKNAKAGAKAKKLGLKKETIKDLSSLKGKAGAVKGGAKAHCAVCTTPCTAVSV